MKTKEQYVADHFPEVDSGCNPCGAKVLVQLRTMKKKVGSIFIPTSTKEFNDESTKVSKVIALGQIAFKNRDSGELWPEGVWANPGDIVITPAWGGFRFEVPIPDSEDKAIFAIFDDHQIQARIESGFENFDQLL